MRMSDQPEDLTVIPAPTGPQTSLLGVGCGNLCVKPTLVLIRFQEDYRQSLFSSEQGQWGVWVFGQEQCGQKL